MMTKKPPPISEDDGLFFPSPSSLGQFSQLLKKKEKKLSVRGAPHYIEFVLAHATHP
jgi:hypothetical protein